MKGFGKYHLHEGNLFRSEAYLQWGNREECIGTILLHNPGEVTLKDQKMWKALKNREAVSALGELDIKHNDPLNRVRDIIEYAYDNKPNGRLYIYNLFNLVKSDSNIALEEYNAIKASVPNEILYPSLDKALTSPWIWIAWSVTPRKNKVIYEELVIRINKQLQSIGNYKIIGELKNNIHPVMGYSVDAYYPPAPFRVSPERVKEYKQNIAKQIRKFV